MRTKTATGPAFILKKITASLCILSLLLVLLGVALAAPESKPASSNATVLLTGFEIKWKHLVHRINRLGLWFSDQRFDPETSSLEFSSAVYCEGGSWTWFERFGYRVEAKGVRSGSAVFASGAVSDIEMIGGEGAGSLVLNASQLGFRECTDLAVFLTGFSFDTEPEYVHGYPVTDLGIEVAGELDEGAGTLKIDARATLKAGERDLRRGFGTDYRSSARVHFTAACIRDGHCTSSRRGYRLRGWDPTPERFRRVKIEGEPGYAFAFVAPAAIGFSWDSAHYVRFIRWGIGETRYEPASGVMELESEAVLSNQGMLCYRPELDVFLDLVLVQLADGERAESAMLLTGESVDPLVNEAVSLEFPRRAPR